MFILNLTTGTLSFENVRNVAGLPPCLTAETRKANAVLGKQNVSPFLLYLKCYLLISTEPALW